MNRLHETLSDKRLERAAGPGAFGRGAAYHAQNRVDLLSLANEQAVARVMGSETYRVRLRWRGDVAAGSCDCPAFDSTDFCKHMVALAMTVRERASEGETIDRRARLIDHLRRQGLEAAVTRLVALAEQHPEVWAEIEAEAQDNVEDDQTLVRRYRAEIDSACDAPIGWRGVADYAEGLRAMLDRLERLSSGGRATAVAELMVHFLENMQEVFEAIDDSEGEVNAAVQRAVEIHLAACRETKPDPVDLAQWLFAQELGSDWAAFENVRLDYAEVLGKAGMAEYRRLAQEAWTATSAKERAGQYTLRAILDHFARQDGDLDARIALRSAHLSGPYAYLEIIQICVEAERQDMALKWAREAVWIFEDAPNVRLVSLAAQLEEQAGRSDEAVSMLWRAFERSPNLALLTDLKRLSPIDVIDRAAEILKARGFSAMLFEFQLAEGRLDAAWKIADEGLIGEWRLKALADASHQTHRLKARAAYERLAESSVRLANAGAYDAAIKLIRLRGQVCDDPASHAAFISDLAQRHKAKRTFIQRLQGLR